jgi:hydrogenase expression/formation protein HypC
LKERPCKAFQPSCAKSIKEANPSALRTVKDACRRLGLFARAGGNCCGPILDRRRCPMCLGIPGQIVEITDEIDQLAVVNVAGVKREINISCIVNEDHPALSCVGDWVLVHVGFAMSRIDEQEAMKTLQLLTELGEMQSDLQSMQTSGRSYG